MGCDNYIDKTKKVYFFRKNIVAFTYGKDETTPKYRAHVPKIDPSTYISQNHASVTIFINCVYES